MKYVAQLCLNLNKFYNSKIKYTCWPIKNGVKWIRFIIILSVYWRYSRSTIQYDYL